MDLKSREASASGRILLIDPPSEVNLNLPNFALAFGATCLDARVVDLHALPWPASRYLEAREDQVMVSVRPYTLRAAEGIRRRLERHRPGLKVQTLTGVLDVQCCYPFIQPWEPFHLEQPFDDSLPLPEYERFDSFNYLRANWNTGFWAYPMMTSLGCPYACSYCAARHRRWRPRSAAHCLEELRRAIRDYGIHAFEIIDDLFNFDEERVLAFCEGVAPLGLTWSCVNGIRADRFSEAQAVAMARAGCVQVGFGIESVSPAILKGIFKGETLEQIETAVDLAARHLPAVCGFFIIGLPGATPTSDLAALDWARLHRVRAYFSHYVPGPMAPEGGLFFGSAAAPRSRAYPVEEQRRVYATARHAIRASYITRGLFRRVAGATLRSIRHYDARSWVNHLRHLAGRGWKLLRTGDLQ